MDELTTATPRTSESASRLEVSLCDSGWQQVNCNLYAGKSMSVAVLPVPLYSVEARFTKAGHADLKVLSLKTGQ